METEQTKNIECVNDKCPYNEEKYCTKITEAHLLNHISCKEREWKYYKRQGV